MAGYVAAISGLSWVAARIGFDGYQSITSKGPKIEGISTRNAEYYGWKLGYNNTTTFQKVDNLGNSILNTIIKLN